jgi:hypothetical protein
VGEKNAAAARVRVTLTSYHDFLFSDRHRRLYPDPFIYIPDPKIPPFLEMLREGKNADEIQTALELPYRGDVLFATLLLHLARRDGVVELPGIDPDIPAELLPFMPALEQDWADRHNRSRKYQRIQ